MYVVTMKSLCAPLPRPGSSHAHPSGAIRGSGPRSTLRGSCGRAAAGSVLRGWRNANQIQLTSCAGLETHYLLCLLAKGRMSSKARHRLGLHVMAINLSAQGFLGDLWEIWCKKQQRTLVHLSLSSRSLTVV